MQQQVPNVTMERTINPIIAGGRYLMTDGRIGQIFGARRLLDGSLFLIVGIEGQSAIEVPAREFDNWVMQ
jgi:hypothetical protein